MKKIVNRYSSIPDPVKAAFWFLICSFMQKGVSILTTPIFTRLMSTSEYGDYSSFSSWLSICTVIVTMHMYSGVFQQGLVKFENDAKKFSSSIQGLTFMLVLLWTCIYLCFASFWNGIMGITTIQGLSMLVMIWTTTVYNLYATSQRVMYRYRSILVITIITSLLKPTVGIIMVMSSDDKVTARILGLVIVELAAYSWLFVLQLMRGRTFFSKSYWIYALRFNVPLIPHYLSQIILNSTDRIMIRSMVGRSEAGIYSVAYSISMIMTIFNTALLQTMTPWIYRKIKNGTPEDTFRLSYIALLGIAIVNLFLIVLAPEVIAVFAPLEYHEAIYVIPPVAMSVFFLFAYSLFSSFEFYFEKSSFIMTASVTGALANVLLNYLLIPVFGYMAAGYTTLICYIIFAVGHFVIMRYVCRDSFGDTKIYDGKTLMLISTVFVGSGFLMLLTYGLPIVRYTILGIMLLIAVIQRKRIFKCAKSFVGLKKL